MVMYIGSLLVLLYSCYVMIIYVCYIVSTYMAMVIWYSINSYITALLYHGYGIGSYKVVL